MNKQQAQLRYKEILLALIATLMAVGFIVSADGCMTVYAAMC